MTDRNIRLGLVGLGTIARNQHLPSIAATPGVELAAIASRHAGLPDLPYYHDITEMLAAKPGVTAVTLCTPPQGRFAQAAAALQAGRHVMLEKPPGASVSEVAALADLARDKGLTLFTTWHSREAAAVEMARGILAGSKVLSAAIIWKEDVRRWHPGQEWIWQAGGLGVFDPGINALSILTRILPMPVHVQSAVLSVPANKQAPIAVDLSLAGSDGVPVRAAFDFRQTGPQTWDIHVETADGTLILSDGGAKLSFAGEPRLAAPDHEYRRLYARFAQLIAAGQSDVDLTPLQLVADAFLLGERVLVEEFHE